MPSHVSSTFAGPKAVSIFQAIAIKGALKLLAKGIKPNTAYTISNTLATASRFTGKTYPRSKAACLTAAADLEEWINGQA